MLDQLRGINFPIGGFIDAARSHGWQLVPSCWAGAIPSAHVTEDAFERIARRIMDDVGQRGRLRCASISTCTAPPWPSMPTTPRAN